MWLYLFSTSYTLFSTLFSVDLLSFAVVEPLLQQSVIYLHHFYINHILHLSSVYVLSIYHLNNFQYLIQYLYSQIQQLHYIKSITHCTGFVIYMLCFNHFSIYPIYLDPTILYRGFVPCTGDVVPSIYGSKWPLFIVFFNDIFQ